ncbi:tetraspanin [Holotrichia oblita]|uniref:Tetraspanin n=1 Tax=Holotrichia oblita TaxID=644536 RepID=A0ACB9T2A6_HOLOL|nr:tetraspanin [Holotrichia oblita]
MWGAIFIAISSYRERAHATNVSEFKNMFDQYGSDNGDTLLVNAIQNSFQCCGYEKSETMEFVNGTYPWSCCGSPEDVCVHPLFTDGCVQRVSEVLSPILLTISIVYYTMVAVQLLGCGLTGLGIWAAVQTSSVDDNKEDLMSEFNDTYREAFFLIIGKVPLILGPIITIIAFAGFWGAVAQKKWMLKLYVAILIVIVILQTVIGIYAICGVQSNKETFKPQAEGVLNENTKYVDNIQRSLKCCGYYEPSEMQNAAGAYPTSCCNNTDSLGMLRYFDNDGVVTAVCQPYRTGCWYKYAGYLKTGGIIYGGFVGFELAGLALLIIGVLYKLNLNEATEAIPDSLELAPTLLIIVGSIVFVIAFFGCCGAVRESTCMLTTYAVILLILFLLQVAVAVYAFLQIRDTDGLKTHFRSALNKLFGTYNTDPVATETVDIIQRSYQCCGMNASSEMSFGNGSYFQSCCAADIQGPCTVPFATGCFQAVYDFVVGAIKVIGIVAISISAIEIFGAIAALCLSSSIKNQYRRGAYA